jgi:hypothetical protein
MAFISLFLVEDVEELHTFCKLLLSLFAFDRVGN